MTKGTEGRPLMGSRATRIRLTIPAAPAPPIIGPTASSAPGMEGPALRLGALRATRPSADATAGGDTLNAPESGITTRSEPDANRSEEASAVGFGSRYHSLQAPSMRDTYDHAISTTTAQVWRDRGSDLVLEIGWL
jgi:hypothetical protein